MYKRSVVGRLNGVGSFGKSYVSMQNLKFNTQNKNADSSVSIATGYELGAPGMESHWGFRFSEPIHPALGPT